MLRQDYDSQRVLDYCPFLTEGWQHKAAFVIQFCPETDIEEGRFEGRGGALCIHQGNAISFPRRVHGEIRAHAAVGVWYTPRQCFCHA